MNIEQRLHQIKDEVAKEAGYKNWEDLQDSFMIGEITMERYDIFNNTVALRLAKEMCDLQKESDAKAATAQVDGFNRYGAPIISLDRDSILKNPNVCNP